ncbi:Clp protease N-terminal domain-containing protein [Streptomyces sp. WI04-05B]|uniref:Clp protease N-terminal domain-containing protein n=1 Tax=Streptomyces TaxID=1883 RepID=UPI0029A53D88|nr:MULTISPECIES: Clp protease N-terminal domain-containing protein [unclassified Streptomyces]MDX2547651.1 Clp protease N-terminal domain-containing protein [Streptomyces sp. WI04-05B]MDX2590093.1 Clp protease N-terminal domain-containing protein [Streptomyces sp. WI04-05A]MDX3752829.1 Clp protease N-terminal domain-containing protein [Streptomyces sp. AK08-02]
MRSRIPRQSTTEHGANRLDNDARLTSELAAVVAGARRRALRDGDRQIDTAHLLHTLLESDPEVRSVFEGGDPQVARLLGYLVQRSIGYGLRWQGSVEDSGALPVLPGAGGTTGWSPVAASALEEACERAARRGDAPARGVDLLAAIIGDPQSRAVEVLRRGGVDARELPERLRQVELRAAGCEEYAEGLDGYC